MCIKRFRHQWKVSSIIFFELLCVFFFKPWRRASQDIHIPSISFVFRNAHSTHMVSGCSDIFGLTCRVFEMHTVQYDGKWMDSPVARIKKLAVNISANHLYVHICTCHRPIYHFYISKSYQIHITCWLDCHNRSRPRRLPRIATNSVVCKNICQHCFPADWVDLTCQKWAEVQINPLNTNT